MSEPEYETGPFCRHFSDPSDCEIKCLKCGHGCTDHGASDGDYSCGECDCAEWGTDEK